ncbi:arsinothricin resistance N-acetyltransferase ArsN1 family A [Clostridium sp.]|uniref:arsinothricin resistance N-acetyltransferase ArsN1 family A n=1 Tax=Clostridium sp. TaxID=1506 RepID=UPI003217C6D5
MDYIVREASIGDIESIANIYNQGIEDRVATLETRLRTNGEMSDWLNNRESRYKVLVVSNKSGQIYGWASLNVFNSRCCYNGVADISIYISRDHRGNGIGKILLKGLIDLAKTENFNKLVLSTFSFNEVGKKLYRSLGFREVGTYIKQGILDDKFIDITIMEYLL